MRHWTTAELSECGGSKLGRAADAWEQPCEGLELEAAEGHRHHACVGATRPVARSGASSVPLFERSHTHPFADRAASPTWIAKGRWGRQCRAASSRPQTSREGSPPTLRPLHKKRDTPPKKASQNLAGKGPPVPGVGCEEWRVPAPRCTCGAPASSSWPPAFLLSPPTLQWLVSPLAWSPLPEALSSGWCLRWPRLECLRKGSPLPEALCGPAPRDPESASHSGCHHRRDASWGTGRRLPVPWPPASFQRPRTRAECASAASAGRPRSTAYPKVQVFLESPRGSILCRLDRRAPLAWLQTTGFAMRARAWPQRRWSAGDDKLCFLGGFLGGAQGMTSPGTCVAAQPAE